MTDDRSCHGQLAQYDRKKMEQIHKDYSMECFTKFVFKIPHYQFLILTVYPNSSIRSRHFIITHTHFTT